MINAQASHEATAKDDQLLHHAHPFAYSFLKQIGNKFDVKRVGPLGVIVSEAQTLRDILLDAEHFSKVGKGGSSDLWTPIIGDSGLINMDGPSHAHLRKQLAPLFTPKFVLSLVEDSLKPHLDAVKDQLLAGETVDLVAVVEESAAKVICNITGLSEEDQDEQVLHERIAKVRELTSFVKLTRKKMKPYEIIEAKKRLDFLNASVSESYKNGNTSTVPGRLREAGLAETDAVAVISALVIAGTETILSFVPRLAALLIDSEHLDYLSANLDNMQDTLNEAMRIIVPTPVMVRSVIKDTVIRGVPVKEGDRVVLSTVVACHKPGDFDPFRSIPKEMRNLWFGAGAHFCIGMPLAMAQSNLFAEMFAEVNKIKPLKIISRQAKRKTLAGGYERLHLQCQM